MAFDNRKTYLCYNNRSLIRDGFIPSFIEKLYLPVDSFNVRRLKNPQPGVTYTVGRDADTNEIISVKERKKQLPASKIQVQIEFSKTLKSAISRITSPGSPMLPGAVGGTIGNLALGAQGFGGLTSGYTEITFQIVESKTIVNQKVTITQDILDTSILTFDGFPLSIFGIVKEHVETFAGDGDSARDLANQFKIDHPQAKIAVDKNGALVARIGLDFSLEQIDKLGNFSEGSFQGSGRKRISGATDSKGLFGGTGSSWLVMVDNAGEAGFDVNDTLKREVVFFEGQKQLFKKIVEDKRKTKFRGDNHDAVGSGEYPFHIRGTTGTDAVDKQIRIDTTDLAKGDVIYVTHEITVGERHVRKSIEHKGTVAQGNTIGIVGWSGAVQSVMDAYDYKIRKWKVPPFPKGRQDLFIAPITMNNIDEITTFYTSDDDYKLSLYDFLEIDAESRENEDFKLSPDDASEIEGWRLSEAILWRKMRGAFFAADHRGILVVESAGEEVVVLFPRSEIRDQEWFTAYLESLDFTFATGPIDPNAPLDQGGFEVRTYLPTDLEKNIEDSIDFKDMSGFLFDTGEIVNSLLFDREKIHYYRPFANALKSVSPYREEDTTKGVGIPHLDLLPIISPFITIYSIETETIDEEEITRREYDFSEFDCSIFDCKSFGVNLEYYDLSQGVFDQTEATPTPAGSCEENEGLSNLHYWSYNQDPDDGLNPGAYLVNGALDLEINGWFPEGLSIDTFWTMETPYLCGSFGADTRVHVEKMGGNSLDNYSWIYVNTVPFIPNNIAADTAPNATDAIVVFNEDNVHNGLSYSIFNDIKFQDDYSLVKIDKTRIHAREPFDHDKDFIIGQNGLVGDVPSYSHGAPISEDIFRVCSIICDKNSESDYATDFWFNKDLLNDTADYGVPFGLSFSDTPPKVDIPPNWYVKWIEIEFAYNEGGEDAVKDIEKYVSFYFEDSESSISKLLVTELGVEENTFTVRFLLEHYNGGPFHFLGKFWEKVNISKATARFVLGNDSSLPEALNFDTYKIDSGQSAVVYDNQRRILVFYSNQKTNNIDVAISYSEGEDWEYDRNIIRLIEGETATMPFTIKDGLSEDVHLFYSLNNRFLMYKTINTSLLDSSNGFAEPIVPDSYLVGDYDHTTDDPEREMWGNYTPPGTTLRRLPSFFVVANADDDFFIEQAETNEQISIFNEALPFGVKDVKKIQTPRFLFGGNSEEMRTNFDGSAYSVFLDDDGSLKLFFVENGNLSVKSSTSYASWQYEVESQPIHKNYINEDLDKGFSEEISNIQIVRNDKDQSVVSVLYFHNGMLFVRNLQANSLYSWRNNDGKLEDQDMIRHLEIKDEDLTLDPIRKRTENLPIFLVGNIPDVLKTDIKNEIGNKTPAEDSVLAFIFPYTDPDTPGDIEANKAMVDRFNADFDIDTNTQVYAYTTATGLIRIFYKDSLGQMNGIIIDSFTSPNLEVMNVFKGI